MQAAGRGFRSLRQLERLMAGNGAFPLQGVQGERISGYVAGLVGAAAGSRGIIFETGIDREIATQSLCQQILCKTLRWRLAADPVRLYE